MSATPLDLDSAPLRKTLFSATRVFDITTELDRSLRDVPVAQRRCLAVQELASQLGAKPPAISQIVDRLVRRGLVERRTDSQDRRISRVYFTPEAQTLIQHARDTKERRISEAFGRLEPSLREGLIRGLQALASAC
jgi:DNA-binding MarR family transcriptional regulator